MAPRSQASLLFCAAAVVAADLDCSAQNSCGAAKGEDDNVALLQHASASNPFTSSSEATVITHRSPYSIMTCPKPGGAILQTRCLSHFGYQRITKAVREALESLSDECTESDCQRADWAGCVLRLAGHDFMDYKDGKGGSDACMDLDLPDNAGLEACLKESEPSSLLQVREFGADLQQIYEQFCSEVSLADFLVIAGEAVMSFTRDTAIERNAEGPPVNFEAHFRFGRKTSKQCEDNVALPDVADGCAAVETTFNDQMGLDWAGAAALMGVHTLGRAREANSGFEGWWASPRESMSFDNTYYVSMAGSGWQPHQVNGDGKWQWGRVDRASAGESGHQMMLNTDLCLLYTNGKNFQEIGQPVLAPRDQCCAWTVSRRIQEGLEYSGRNYCGGSVSHASGEHMILDGGDEEHHFCCHGHGEEEELLQKTSEAGKAASSSEPEDCGNFFNPESVAAEAVLKYANDEAAWLTVFQKVWNQATENGFESRLRSLKRWCHCDLKYLPSHTSSSEESTSE